MIITRKIRCLGTGAIAVNFVQVEPLLSTLFKLTGGVKGGRVWEAWTRPWSRVQGSGFRFQGSGFKVQGLGFRVLGFKVRAWVSKARV